MNAIMLDLETLSLAPNALILSVGAVAFNLTTTETTHFYYTVDYTRQQGGQFHYDINTIKWWLTQEDTARREAAGKGTPLGKVCEEFNAFWRVTGAKEIWANGADFDIPILAHAFQVAGYNGPPWQYSQTRCYRTMRALAKQQISDWQDVEFIGTCHNALTDAAHQVRNLRKIMETLKLV